ncbi:germinal-center associated nuclear protein isoform X2 [Panicum miliaceum]|uniref:Germinal-center associated nuclear protein isoform X2 n=1 Tax=Panicum miliaceum TaxID=4540 RepID=A0A3L6QTG8_PANMI|nr:germinal-center associated nuclear protein isoform X2 [Panicum miliaceum]
MAASGFGREAGPSTRGPGTAFPAFGVGAATQTATAPSAATPSFSLVRPATPSIPSVRPTTPSFPSARPVSLSFPSARSTNPPAAATPRFPSPRPQLATAATASRPATTPAMPIPVPSARPAAAPGAAASARFPSPRPTLDPGAVAATGRHVARHLQPQPRPATPSVSRPVDPFISSRSRALSAVSNLRADSPADYGSGTGQRRFTGPLQNRSLDHNISKRSRSPTLSYQDVDGTEARIDTGGNSRRLVDYTDTLIGDENVETSKRMRPPASEFTRTIKSPPSDIRDNIRSSPNLDQNLRAHADVQKSNTSIPKFRNQIQSHIGGARSPPHQMSSLLDDSNKFNTSAVSPPKPSILSATRRMGTSPLDASDDDHSTPSTELEREKQAKAKRLARFHVELSRPVENTNDFVKTLKGSADKPKQATSVGKIPMKKINDTDENTLADMDSPMLAAIVGLCPDMCPEPERAERERKGDLDRYERLDGDRNLTTELLAVKKYNRTAERDADLIRPLPVLQKTMDYLLSLLDHTYDDSFLGLYNFLWDRMRAIRMDLRMQHFFNQEAISMLEQMIRLHIIAMHELCEYNKGEGFSEGFDAHLNIEQMNKTSVELFQMYDDHRRKGVFFSTEKEFRGYYALLKLDKHPGYKVEPAELSLDLAKMSREIRGSPEILFAREVARACRMGNFIAFFRLARKATYLQACLMHAHFAKLRRQALASLHSGLQSGQGIPISQVVEWLAMEDENIESLLEYHGFGLRQYEELYLVKEGPFLNSESDFPSGCSQLVHLKKSQRVIVDVSSGPVCAPISKKNTSVSYPSQLASGKRDLFPSQHAPVVPHDGRRDLFSLFSGPVSTTPGRHISSPFPDPFSPKAANKLFSPKRSSPLVPNADREENVSTFPTVASPHSSKKEIFSKTPKVASPKAEGKTKLADDLTTEDQDSGLAGSPQKVDMQTGILWSQANTENINALAEPIVSHSLTDGISLDYYSNMLGEEDKLDMDEGTPPDHEVLVIEPGSPIGSPLSDHNEYEDQNISNSTVNDWLPIVTSPKTQISDEKLKAILRKWRQRAEDKRFHREQKNVLAVAALCSLSLGPPVHNTTMVSKLAVEELDIGHAFKERQVRQQRSWSRLNVSELSGPILLETNPDARCFCWKLLVLVPQGAMESQTNNFASKWLLRKLMGSGNGDSGLVVSSAGLSIWTEWISFPNTCCLSVVRASDQQVIGNDIANGTSCIAFVVSEGISWETQKARLSSLLASIPVQSHLPLLILSGDTYHEGYDYASQYIIDRLGLSGLHGEKIASSLVIFLVEHMEYCANGFFDDDNLREGLKWLIRSLPRQPDVTLVKTHELLLNCLHPQLELLNTHVAPGAGPGDCISVFNNAVDQVAEEILAAACTNANQWPALEIDLLERTSNERRYAEMFLPSTGWSSPSRIQPLLAAINTCKIPEFSYDLSWLNQGSHMGKQTQDQKKFLQECLARYLTESTRLLDETQVATEVNIMVQKYVGLELRDSYYYLVPRWVAIFRRIYNWRLAKLSTGEFSEAYVLSQHLYQAPPAAANSNGATATQELTSSSSTCIEASILEDHSMMPAVSTGLSLDEIIEISCDLDAVDAQPASEQPRPPIQIHEEPHAPADTNSETNMVHGISDEMHIPRRIESGELVPLERDDKLARLLEQCTKLQDRIDETLSIYF